MKLFLVSAQDDSAELAEKKIKRHFHNHNIRLENRESPLWVIATANDQTPASVVEALDMTGSEGDSKIGGIVVQIYDYYGYDSMKLWQQMELWSNE